MSATTEQFNGRTGLFSRTHQAMLEVLDSFGRALGAAVEVEHLYNLPDEALSARGLTREAIPAHIARHYFGV